MSYPGTSPDTEGRRSLPLSGVAAACRVCGNARRVELLIVVDQASGDHSFICRPSLTVGCWYSSIRDRAHEAIALLVPLTAAERAAFLALKDERRRQSDAAKAAA